MEFGQAAITMVKFTSDPAEFEKGVNRIVSRPGVGSVLGEALEAANKDLVGRPAHAARHRVAQPRAQQRTELRERQADQRGFRKSGAQLWSVSVQRGGLKNSKRDVVLNDFAKLTGGQRDFIVGISAVEGILKGYADALAYQYEVVFKRPESNKDAKVIQVGRRARASSCTPAASRRSRPQDSRALGSRLMEIARSACCAGA